MKKSNPSKKLVASNVSISLYAEALLKRDRRAALETNALFENMMKNGGVLSSSNIDLEKEWTDTLQEHSRKKGALKLEDKGSVFYRDIWTQKGEWRVMTVGPLRPPVPAICVFLHVMLMQKWGPGRDSSSDSRRSGPVAEGVNLCFKHVPLSQNILDLCVCKW